jgi:hypothetical protein
MDFIPRGRLARIQPESFQPNPESITRFGFQGIGSRTSLTPRKFNMLSRPKRAL